jgi:acyl dehydratase
MSYGPVSYLVGREKVREFARATGETDPLHLDPAAARAAGHADVVAPPMFAVVYCAEAIAAALFDPALGIDFARLVHGAQEFTWGPLVVAGDEIATTASVAEVTTKGELGVFTFATESVNGGGDTVCTGTWTNYVRP